MGTPEPSAAEAREAIARAAAAREAVRSADRLFRPRLLAIAGATVGLALLLAVFSLLPKWGVLGPVEGFIVAGAIAGVVVMVTTLQMRQRAYSRRANLWFGATILVFVFWASRVEQWSFASGWLAYQLPPLVRGWHLLLSAVVATVPLLVSALLIGRRR